MVTFHSNVMVNKFTAAVSIIVVVLVVVVGVIYASDLMNTGKNSSTSNAINATPEQRAPNIVNSQVVSSALGSQWTMSMGASGSSLNASTFISGTGITTGFSNVRQVAPNIGFAGNSMSPFSTLSVGNNLSYNTFQIGLFVPPQDGFAGVSFAHSTNSSAPASLVSCLNSQISANFNGATSYNSTNTSYDSGTVNGSEYVFLSTNSATPHGWYLEGLLANYSSYNIVIFYFTPQFTGHMEFINMLTAQISDIKSQSTSNVPSILVSSAQINKITGINYKTQSAIAVNLNNTKKMLSEYLYLTGGSSDISSTNYTILNNTVGNINGLVAKYMSNGENVTFGAIISFSNSTAPATLYDLIQTSSASGTNIKTSSYDGWNFIFQNVTDYSYHYNYTTGSYTSIPYSNTTTVLAVNGDYMLLFVSNEKNQVFTESMAQQLLSDESTMI